MQRPFRGKSVLVDEYGFSKPEIYVPKAQFWNCQEPTASDAGQWAVVSAGMIEDAHKCDGYCSPLLCKCVTNIALLFARRNRRDETPACACDHICFWNCHDCRFTRRAIREAAVQQRRRIA